MKAVEYVGKSIVTFDVWGTAGFIIYVLANIPDMPLLPFLGGLFFCAMLVSLATMITILVWRN